MIEKKPLINTIKRALQTGTFNYIGQQVKEIPPELFHIDQIDFNDQNWWECLPITKIDLSNNQIIEISSQILNLPDIQLVRMKNNKLLGLNPNLLKLQNIKVLDLAKNSLVQLPKQLSYCSTLVELNFSQNKIEFCPDLSSIATLQNFFITDNRLKQLPSFGKGLKKLQASNNTLRQIKKQIFALCTQLQTINLSKNTIEQIEKGSFCNAGSLTILQMKQNRLDKFQQIPKSQKLDTINLAFNNLKEYSYFENSPNLTVLILSNNKLTKIMKDVVKLQKLKTLDLQNNDLPQLPCELGFINSLVRLQVEGNPLKTIRQSVRNGGTNVIKKYLKDRMPPEDQAELSKKFESSFQKQSSEKEYWLKLINQFSQSGQLVLRNMKLQNVDPIVYSKNLKGLNLTENNIKELSEEIGQLTALKYLIVSKNLLQTLPSSLGTIPSLDSIQAKNNKLTTFGSLTKHSLNTYTSLRHLDLSGNKFHQIPKSILLLKQLRTLYISYNSIKSIDDVWKKDNLPNLQVIDVSNNALMELSDQVYYKSKLNFLNVENNSLTKLPTVLGFMKLSALKVDGNPLKLIKRTVIQKGTIALLDFLRTKHVGTIPQAVQSPIQEKIQVQVEEQKWPYQGTNQRGKIQNENLGKFQPHSQFSRPLNYQEQIPEELAGNFEKQQGSKGNIQQLNSRIKPIQKQISQIQYQLDNNYGLNNVKRNQKRKLLQALMIQKNKLLKERDGY